MDGTFRFRRIEIEARSRTDFAEATDNAIAQASALCPGLRWFKVGKLFGRIEAGKRADYRIRFEVGE